MVQYRDPYYPLGGVRHIGSLQVCSKLSFPFIPSILEPDFDLGLCEVERGCQACPLRAAQIPLHVKGGLQLEDLTPAEDGAGFLLPGGFLV